MSGSSHGKVYFSVHNLAKFQRFQALWISFQEGLPAQDFFQKGIFYFFADFKGRFQSKFTCFSIFFNLIPIFNLFSIYLSYNQLSKIADHLCKFTCMYFFSSFGGKENSVKIIHLYEGFFAPRFTIS